MLPPYRLPPVYMQVPQGKPKHRMRNCLITGVVLLVGLILVLFTQNSTPYPWSLTIHSGYSRATTLFGVPIGGEKYVQLHITLTNVSAADNRSPNDFVWTLTDTRT